VGTGRSVAAASAPKLRLPAATIDELVLTKLQSFLTDKAQISTLLREKPCRPAEIGSGLGIASKFADSLTSAAPIVQNVTDLLARVAVSPTSLNISIKRDRLLAMLTSKSTPPHLGDRQDKLVSFEVPFPVMPAGGSGKLVFEDQNAKTPDAVVVKAIARASIWFEQLTTGKSQSMAQIALAEDITDNYVSNLIHLAWLSPDLVGRVMEGDSEATALARAAMLSRKSDALWERR
jgi:site-specific DNA recombinase